MYAFTRVNKFNPAYYMDYYTCHLAMCLGYLEECAGVCDNLLSDDEHWVLGAEVMGATLVECSLYFGLDDVACDR